MSDRRYRLRRRGSRQRTGPGRELRQVDVRDAQRPIPARKVHPLANRHAMALVVLDLDEARHFGPGWAVEHLGPSG
jgi:hypothetical protein